MVEEQYINAHNICMTLDEKNRLVIDFFNGDILGDTLYTFTFSESNTDRLRNFLMDNQ